MFFELGLKVLVLLLGLKELKHRVIHVKWENPSREAVLKAEYTKAE